MILKVTFLQLYKIQTELFESVNFKFEGDTSLWKNSSDTGTDMIEFVTSPNNPDGQLKKAVLHGPHAKAIYDRAYYRPHFTPIPAPANEDVMIFTLSKLTDHAGSNQTTILILHPHYSCFICYFGRGRHFHHG